MSMRIVKSARRTDETEISLTLNQAFTTWTRAAVF